MSVDLARNVVLALAYTPTVQGDSGMYERFTVRVRKVMQLATKEAQGLSHQSIGTEHILLGLMREGSGVGANVLKNSGVDLDSILREVELLVQRGPESAVADKQRYTRHAKRVIEYAIEEARGMSLNSVGTEHLLLGLLRNAKGHAAVVLTNLGVELTKTRAEVISLLGQRPPKEAGEIADANRKMNSGTVFLIGLVAGVVSYLIAEALTPQQVASPADHDVLLANRLGFIYAPVAALWIAWLQRSWSRALLGVAVGVAVGFAYMALCSGRNFLAIMVGFPCMLGGVLSAAVGSNQSPWLDGLGARLAKGLLAGFVLGFVYMVVLNVAGGMVMTVHDDLSDRTQRYVTMMWRAGPIALGLSSGPFFVLIQWAVGLVRGKELASAEWW